MAATLDELLAWKAALIKASASGVLSVRDDSGKSVTYRDLKDLLAAIALIEQQIAGLGGGQRVRMVRVHDRDGF